MRKKPKPKIASRTLEFEIGKVSPAELAELAKAGELDGLGVYPMADGSGVTFGRSLGYGEHEGDGLPDWKVDRQLLIEQNLNFVVRVTCDPEGTTYLEIHQEGHQSYFRFPFKGIQVRDLCPIADLETKLSRDLFSIADFENRLSTFLILYGIYPLFWAFYRSKESEQDERTKAYDKITTNFENFFKGILKPKRKRTIEKREIEPGIEITSYSLIETGREPGTTGTRTLSAKEQERKSLRLRKIADAIRQAKNNENKTELAQLIGISQRTIRRWLQDIGINSDEGFYDLIRKLGHD